MLEKFYDRTEKKKIDYSVLKHLEMIKVQISKYMKIILDDIMIFHENYEDEQS